MVPTRDSAREGSGCEAACPALRLFMERTRTISTRPNTSCACPSLIRVRLEHGQTAGSAPQGQGPGVPGTVESGRPPPGRVGRFVPTGNSMITPSFPGHYVPSELRSITGITYTSRSSRTGTNSRRDVVAREERGSFPVGTDRPARGPSTVDGRPLSTALSLLALFCWAGCRRLQCTLRTQIQIRVPDVHVQSHY